MVDTGFRIALDPMFPPPNRDKRVSQQVPMTQWELCYDSKIDYKELVNLYEEYDKNNVG